MEKENRPTKDVRVYYDFTFSGIIKRRRFFTILSFSMMVPLLCGALINNKNMIFSAFIIGAFAYFVKSNLTTMLIFLSETGVQAYKDKLAGRDAGATQEFVDKLLSLFVTDTLLTAGITVLGSGFCAYALSQEGFWLASVLFLVFSVFGVASTSFLLINPLKYYLER